MSAKYPVLRTAVHSSGSENTVAKFSQPTKVGAVTRFVCCTLITAARTIGNQENTPNTTTRGSRKSRVLKPPRRTHVSIDDLRSAPVDDRLDVAVGLAEQLVDVRARVAQHGLDDGVEHRVHLLGLRRRLA